MVNKCERETGKCEGYNDTSKEFICDNNEYYGDYCENKCPDNCKNGCKKDGSCVECKEGYTGNDCTELCNQTIGFENCVECLQNGSKCTKCKLGFWGEDCSNICNETKCSIKSIENNCNIETGKCVECNKNYFGDDCEKKWNCPTDCDKFGKCSDVYCPSGYFGTGCEKVCECSNETEKNICGKYSGECLNCDFGYYGKNCDKHCYYLCKSTTCCIFKNNESKKLLKIQTNYKYLKLYINDTERILQIDYSNGDTLTLFTNNTKFSSNNINIDNTKFNYVNKTFEDLYYTGDEINSTESIEYFTDYTINVQPSFISKIDLDKSNFFEDEGMKEGKKGIIKMYPMVAKSVTVNKEPDQKIDGVIGLGFFNMFTENLLEEGLIYRNVISFSFDKKNESNINILFGKLNEDETKNFDQLSYCKLVLQEEKNILNKDISCKLDGLFFSEEDSAYKVTNTNVIFSLSSNSSFNLGYINTDKNTTMNEFFNNRYFNSKFNDNCKGFTTNNVIQYYCKKSIEKYLSNIGFLINNHVYSFEPKYFFEETNNDDIEEKNEYKYKFKITFYNEDLNDESKKNYIVIGKDLLHDTHLTIDNEEYLVYFYTKKQEYFSSNIIDIYKSNYSNKAMKPYQYSIIIIAIIIILNIISFLIYLYYKNKKKKKINVLDEKLND